MLGAYSTIPVVRQADDGTFRAGGNVQSWRGTLGDLCRLAEAVIAALDARDGQQPEVVVSVADWSGAFKTFATVDEFRDASVDTDTFSSVRFDFGDEHLRGVAVARRTLPGLTFSAVGSDRLSVDGLARLLYQKAMRGYVDRYGGLWRPTAAFGAVIPITIALAVGENTDWPRWVYWLLGIGTLAVTFLVMVNSWQWTLSRTPLEFVADDVQPRDAWWARASETVSGFVAQRRWIARVLGLLGVVLVGLATNTLYDVIPWPWDDPSPR